MWNHSTDTKPGDQVRTSGSVSKSLCMVADFHEDVGS